MSNYVNDFFEITKEQITSFKQQGFLHLKGIFSPRFISHIKNKIDQDIDVPIDKYQAGFNRIAFDLFNDDDVLNTAIQSDSFIKMMLKLCDMQLLYTQALGFELKKNVSKGFPWHIGTQSFGFQKAEDFGCTIWTPLSIIDTKAQRGGMAYVPKNKVSGEFMYHQIDPAISELTADRINRKENIELEEFVHLRDGPLNDPAMKKLLDHFAIEHDFELGDALIFDKCVIHRSIFLEDGPIESRAAFVMRFVCANSKYDKQRAENLEIPRKYFNYSGPTKFHLEVADKNDAYLKDSKLFLSNINVRLLGKSEGE